MTAPPSLTSPFNTRRSRESDLTHENDTSFSTIAFLPTNSPLVSPRIPKTTAGDDNSVPVYVRTHHVHGLEARILWQLLAVVSTNSLLQEHNCKPKFALCTDRTRPFQTAQPSSFGDCSLIKGDVLHGFQFRGWHANYEPPMNDELRLSKAEVACFGFAQQAIRMYNLRNFPQANSSRTYVTPRVQNRQFSDRRRHTYWHTTLCLVGGFIYGGLHLFASRNEYKSGSMRWAWRCSSLYIAAAGLLIPLLKLGELWHSPPFS